MSRRPSSSKGGGGGRDVDLSKVRIPTLPLPGGAYFPYVFGPGNYKVEIHESALRYLTLAELRNECSRAGADGRCTARLCIGSNDAAAGGSGAARKPSDEVESGGSSKGGGGPVSLYWQVVRSLFPDGLPKIAVRALRNESWMSVALRLVNKCSDRRVSLEWRNERGISVPLISNLPPGQWVDVNTYVGHPIVATDSRAGTELHINGAEVHWPCVVLREGKQERTVLNVTLPMRKLKAICVEEIRSRVSQRQVHQLPIPDALRKMVLKTEEMTLAKYFFIDTHLPGILPRPE